MMKAASLIALVVSTIAALAEPVPDCHGGALKRIPPNAQILILEAPAHRAAETGNMREEMDIVRNLLAKKCLKNEVFSQCKSNCQHYCDLEAGSVHLPGNCSGKCEAGCVCKKGYVRPPRDAPFKECISLTTCKGLIEASKPDQE